MPETQRPALRLMALVGTGRCGEDPCVPAMGLAEHEVLCDFTGGTHPMSAGILLACGARRPMQYMSLTRYAGQR